VSVGAVFAAARGDRVGKDKERRAITALCREALET
jgi:hypothetical protein